MSDDALRYDAECPKWNDALEAEMCGLLSD